MRRVLIANRGEIALRVIRTCREQGVTSVLAHSEADADSLAARQADETICIGPPPALKSYLHIPSVVGAARAFNCDAIHPGYGFLSESGELASACDEAGLIFIGPKAATLEHMGDKIKARQTASEAGVPVIPGSPGAVESAEQAMAMAGSVGYPVLLKAAMGGGGIGIRPVESDKAMARLFAEASAEAAAAFGDGRLYVEKRLTNMRHVEVQIMGDGRGNAVHLFERDCSLQRRRQKLIEEAPAVLVGEATRKKLHRAAVDLARELKYRGAGTVEFLVRGEDFHFMEMNARLQVEHGVTEMITGTDLVAAQLAVARGDGLPWAQSTITAQGHAMECRINAEDPVTAMPAPGTVRELALPSGPGVRVDTGLFPGLEIPVWYDSLVAKIVAHHETREQTKQRMLRSLAETRITGVTVNTAMHETMIETDRFAEATV
jgi:acetyl-CoA carboxylase biotin carboxylase subunit